MTFESSAPHVGGAEGKIPGQPVEAVGRVIQMLAVILVLSGPGIGRLAWSGEVHELICGIAWQRMSDDARALVTDLLGVSTQPAMARSCVWADEVRATTHRFTSSYHYVNVDPTADDFDFERDCGDPEQRCVTWAIVHYGRQLVDPGLSRDHRAEALKFLCHFVGDVHQPLHAAYAADRGGNRTYVNAWGRRTNLHALWDGDLLARSGLLSPDSIEHLDATIPDSLFRPTREFDPVAWTNESYALVRNAVYQLPADSTVTEEYFSRAVAISRERIQEAAARLTLLLDAAAAGTLQFRSFF